MNVLLLLAQIVAGPDGDLTAARDAARKAEKPATVQLRGGTYRLKETLVLGPEDSGVTWTAAPGETVVLSGGRVLSGWAKDGARWVVEEKAPVRQLYIDGRRRPRARTPNEGYFRIVKAGPDDRTSFEFKPGDLKAWPDLASAELVFLHDWSITRLPIGAVDEASKVATFRFPIGPSARHYAISWFEKQPRYFVENLLEALDRPGEWVSANGKVTYRPVDGEDPARVEAVVPVHERLLEIRGAKDLKFVGLTFSHSAWTPPAAGYAESQAAQYEPRDETGKGKGRAFVPAAVRVESSENVTFERCRFEHLGGSGLWLGKGSRKNLITQCVFSDIAANGVMVGEARATEEDLARDNTLTRSLVEHCGAEYYGAVGVWGGITQGLSVTRNEIRALPYTGVSIGWVWNPTPSLCQGNRIEANHIHHVMQILSDGGGIYTLGRQPGTVLRGNHIHDVPLNAGRAESNGIFMDEGTTDLVVEANVIWAIEKAPIRFHKAYRNELRNNVLVVPKGGEPFRYNASKPDDKVFEGNTTPDPASWTPPDPASLQAGP